jgi:magnesium transporter
MSVFRVLELDANRQQSASEGEERVAPPEPGVLRWIDLQASDEISLRSLAQRFPFHPLAIEDCMHLDQRPKLEEYGDHLFLVTQGFSCHGERVRVLELNELHAFLGERYLVTVRAGAVPALDEVWRRVALDPTLLGHGVDFIYYLVADRLADSTFPILDRIADELDELQDQVLESPHKSQLLRIFELKRHLVAMRKVLSPQRDTMSMLARRGDSRIKERTSLYFRDVYDHLVRITESIESNRDLLGGALEAYLSATSNRTNEIMKYLTLLSAIFLPLAFIVGFFGQNFDNLPGIPAWPSSDALMGGMVVLCLGTPLVMLLWFRRRGWF